MSARAGAGAAPLPPPTADPVLERLMALHPKIIDLSLGRMHRILAALGHPERALTGVVHVAGTNGKGSTTAMIRAGLEAAGRTTNVYTSPHLARFNERIRLHGRLIAEPDLIAVLEDCEAANGGEPITYFEITTAAALLAFARRPADHVLLEVGLGGRLDATNVVDRPAMTVITPVSLDHQQYLGETVDLIAGEKAGILKPGVPCVVGPQVPEALEVIEARAAALGAPLRVAGRDWDVRAERGRLVYEDEGGLLDLDPPALPGAHQVVNAGAAIAALRWMGLDEAACAAAPARAEWPARLQRLDPAAFPGAPEGAEIWLDGGHNVGAGAVLAAHMAALEERRPAPLHLVVGMLETKDSAGFLAHFAGLAREVRTVTIPDAAAATPAESLAEAAARAGLAARPAASVDSALAEVPATPEAPAPRVLICGSLYLAGHILRRVAPPA